MGGKGDLVRYVRRRVASDDPTRSPNRPEEYDQLKRDLEKVIDRAKEKLSNLTVIALREVPKAEEDFENLDKSEVVIKK